MGERANLTDDLKILRDMYPEMETCNDSHNEMMDNLKVTGILPFKVSLPEDLTVTYNEQRLVLSELTEDSLKFTIDSTLYPDLRRGIQFTIESQWMSQKDQEKISDAIYREFGVFTDSSLDTFEPSTPTLMLLFGFLTSDIANELFECNERHCNSQEEFNLFAAISSIIKREKMERSNFDCCICMETKKGSKMVALPCGHLLCLLCTKSYFKTLIEEGNLTRVRCPECEYQEPDLNKLQSYSEIKKVIFEPMIPLDFFKGILSDELCLRYADLFYSQAASKLSQHCLYACVTCRRCNKWCVKEDLNDSMIECKSCEYVFCFDCLHSWHGYINRCGKKVEMPRDVIEEYVELMDTVSERKRALEAKYGKKIIEHEAKDFLAERMLDLAVEEEGSDLQRCPKCRTVVQRSEGCNKMKCAICDTMFCYLCGVDLYPEDPYAHFKNIKSGCYARLFEGMPGAS